MDLNTRLRQVAVVGAAGKMGSGISLLLAREIGYRALTEKNELFVLNLIDVSDAALQGLLRYIREQTVKDAEKQVNRLRDLYRDRTDLVENGEIIQEFVHEVLVHVRTGKTLELAKESLLVFEAAFEKEEVKFSIYKELARMCPTETWFLTNTSSIPLHVLTNECGISGRLIGYHFYNPPAVQKLVELITPQVCDAGLIRLSHDLARVLGKKIVPANDIAGFIGNGHFMRDGLYAIGQAENLALEHGFVQAVYMVERVSRDFLLRPMGIFQLIDYVGIDVCQLILRVMDKYQPQAGLHSHLIDRYIESGIRGGQTSSGAQKDGFLKYEKGRPAGIYDPQRREYAALDPGGWGREADIRLGEPPSPGMSWKGLQKDPEREAKLRAWFGALRDGDTLGVKLAREYFLASRKITLNLVAQGVADSPEAVNSVLTLGFFHLYGPVNDYLD